MINNAICFQFFTFLLTRKKTSRRSADLIKSASLKIDSVYIPSLNLLQPKNSRVCTLIRVCSPCFINFIFLFLNVCSNQPGKFLQPPALAPFCQRPCWMFSIHFLLPRVPRMLAGERLQTSTRVNSWMKSSYCILYIKLKANCERYLFWTSNAQPWPLWQLSTDILKISSILFVVTDGAA